MKIPHGFVLVIVTFALLASQAIAEPISYQGYLEQQGQPFSDSANLEFRLFTADSEGTQVGPTKTRSNWPVQDGLFQVELDFGDGVFTGAERFLEIRVDGVPLSPRQRITPAPMAVHAFNVPQSSVAEVRPFNVFLSSNISVRLKST